MGMGRMVRNGLKLRNSSPLHEFSAPVQNWFKLAFPEGPTKAQELAWSAIASDQNLLLVAPTGTGKTLAAFLAILDRLLQAKLNQMLNPGIRCVYISPLRSLNYDIERNLQSPLDGICRQTGYSDCPLQVGVRTGDTPNHERRALRNHPPHILITTPESLSLLLSQESWQAL
jgi:ATP-dependent Lhr-like helicase